MQLEALVLAAALPLGGAGAAAALARTPNRATTVGYGCAALGALLLLLLALLELRTPQPMVGLLAWELPLGRARFGTDALTAWLLMVCALVTLPAAIAGASASRRGDVRNPVVAVIAFDLLVVGIVGTLLARDLILLLLAWELMAAATFLSVSAQGRGDSGRKAAWTYLVATQLGTMPLLVFVVLLMQQGGTDFPQLGELAGLPLQTRSLLLVLALLGFGAKSGMVPLHLWLPEAHPAAPAHVSAVLSGVMVTTGIYGLLRAISWLGDPPLWWGLLVLTLGLSSALLGVAQALAQTHLKRLLAYSTVENVGLILTALGVALLGAATDLPMLQTLGVAAALWMLLSHGLAKGLLFLAAGAIIDRCGAHGLDSMGGLLKRMPQAGSALLLGAAALVALPPLGGFIGELLLVLALLQVGAHPPLMVALALVATLGVVALVGGLAVATMANAVGAALLGNPRSRKIARALDVSGGTRAALVLLCGSVIGISIAAPALVLRLQPVLGEVIDGPTLEIALVLARLQGPLVGMLTLGAIVATLVAGLLLLRERLLRDASVRRSVTWDCGFAAPTARMQYTATSLAAPLALGLGPLSGLSTPPSVSNTPFPDRLRLRVRREDPTEKGFFSPLLRGTAEALHRFSILQRGQVQLYVLYIVATLVVLLAIRGR